MLNKYETGVARRVVLDAALRTGLRGVALPLGMEITQLLSYFALGSRRAEGTSCTSSDGNEWDEQLAFRPVRDIPHPQLQVRNGDRRTYPMLFSRGVRGRPSRFVRETTGRALQVRGLSFGMAILKMEAARAGGWGGWPGWELASGLMMGGIVPIVGGGPTTRRPQTTSKPSTIASNGP